MDSIQTLWETYQADILRIALQVAAAVIILIVGFRLIAWLSKRVQRLLEARDLEVSVVSFLTSFLSIGLKVLLLLSIAGMFGIAVTSFVAVLAALAFAVGLALQGNLGHFASGILLLTFRPFKVGDFIITQGYGGTVKDIHIFNTILTTLDNRNVIVPNGAVLGGPIENLTANPERRLDMTFGIGYGDDIDLTRSTLQEIVSGHENILADKGIDIWVKELADSSVNFAVRAWVKTENYWPTYFQIHEQVKKAFDERSISIPFPQRDVHLYQ
jgi:small conductance mechanosensitive channel